MYTLFGIIRLSILSLSIIHFYSRSILLSICYYIIVQYIIDLFEASGGAPAEPSVGDLKHDLSLSLSFSLSIYISLSLYIYIYTYPHIYIYIYIEREREIHLFV